MFRDWSNRWNTLKRLYIVQNASRKLERMTDVQKQTRFVGVERVTDALFTISTLEKLKQRKFQSGIRLLE